MAIKRIDWEAVKRNFRTGRFTQTELSTLHAVDQATLCRKIKKDRASDPQAWPEDLSQAVREATNARLMTAMVKREVNDGQERVKDTVKAAAEMGASVILGHRKRLVRLLADADRAQAKLMGLMASVADVREAAAVVGAIESLTRTTKAIIDKERESYCLNEAETAVSPDRELSDLELASRMAYFVDIGRRRSAEESTTTASAAQPGAPGQRFRAM